MSIASGPANVGTVTVGTTSSVASAKKPRRYLGIFNQSMTATVYIAFDQPAVVGAIAGQLTLLPLSTATPQQLPSYLEWDGSGFVPGNQVNLIASTAGTPVTVLE